MKLAKGDKVLCKKSGNIGKIVKLGGRSSKVRVPIFGQHTSIIRQIPNRHLVRR
jgi:hypothetical protein